MATFTALAKNLFHCNTKVAGLGEIFVQRKFCCIRYMHVLIHIIFIALTLTASDNYELKA